MRYHAKVRFALSGYDVFDNMGGGRNNNANRESTTSGKGITQSNLAGINYSDDWYKDLAVSSSYNFSNTITNNDSKANQLSFLPTGNILTESDAKTRNECNGNFIEKGGEWNRRTWEREREICLT